MSTGHLNGRMIVIVKAYSGGDRLLKKVDDNTATDGWYLVLKGENISFKYEMRINGEEVN